MNPPGVSWSAGESSAVNDFLNTPVGQKWLGVLLTRKPRIDLASTERAAMSGAFAAGYEHFFNEIASTRVTMQEDFASTRTIDPTKD